MLASPPPVTSSSRGLILASYLAVCILWGSTYLGIAIALESFPPFLLGAARFLASGVLMLGFARLRGEAWPTRPQWLGVAVAGVFLFVIGNGLINVAERSVSTGVAAVLVATMPLWMTVFGRLVGEPVSRLEIAGVVIGLIGVGVMNLGGELRGSPAGVAMLLLAPMGWAIGSLASKRMPSPPGMMRAGGQMLVGGLAMGVVALALGERMEAAPSARAIGAALYLLIAGSLVGFSAYSYLLKHTRPVIATSYAYINPVIAVLLGVTVVGESFDLTSGIGAAIILAAVLLVGLSRNLKPAAAASPPATSSAALRVAACQPITPAARS
jgi:drug/metabolite transporter (DMT)-like permease